MEIVMPPMDDEQIEWCVEMLQTTAKYKDIAILFRDKFDWFAPDFDQETFCERFVSRLNDLVNNKRRPYAARIAEGRENNQNSTAHIWMTHANWREEERQAIYEEIKNIGQEMRQTADPEGLNSLKHALDAQKALFNVIGNYEKHQLNIDKLEKSGATGHGITIPETEER